MMIRSISILSGRATNTVFRTLGGFETQLCVRNTDLRLNTKIDLCANTTSCVQTQGCVCGCVCVAVCSLCLAVLSLCLAVCLTTAPKSGAKSKTRGVDKCPQGSPHRRLTAWPGHAAAGDTDRVGGEAAAAGSIPHANLMRPSLSPPPAEAARSAPPVSTASGKAGPRFLPPRSKTWWWCV